MGVKIPSLSERGHARDNLQPKFVAPPLEPRDVLEVAVGDAVQHVELVIGQRDAV